MEALIPTIIGQDSPWVLVAFIVAYAALQAVKVWRGRSMDDEETGPKG